MLKSRQVISSIDVDNLLYENGTDSIEIYDEFNAWFGGKNLIWIGECDGYNFDTLPEPIKDVLKENTNGYVGIYFDN